MALMQWTFKDVYTKVADFLGLGTSPSGSDLTKVKEITYRGYLLFLNPVRPDGEAHVWSFLRGDYAFTTTDGQCRYILPEDCVRIIGEITYSEGSGYPPIRQLPLSEINKKYAVSITEGYPTNYALAWRRFYTGIPQRREVLLYPIPNGTYSLKCMYQITPPKPVNDDDYFVGGPAESEVILQCALSVAENQEDEIIGVQTERAKALLTALMLKDEGGVPDSMGPIIDPAAGTMLSPSIFKRLWMSDSDVTVYDESV